MYFLKKIIFPLLFIISFSCKTRLERQGWQRAAIVSRLDTSTTNKKDKELFVVKILKKDFPVWDSSGKIIIDPYVVKDKGSVYFFNVFFRNSEGKIINEPFPFTTGGQFKSDVAYYKWESDSLCLVKVLNHGNLQASYWLKYSHNSKSFKYLNEPEK